MKDMHAVPLLHFPGLSFARIFYSLIVFKNICCWSWWLNLIFSDCFLEFWGRVSLPEDWFSQSGCWMVRQNEGIYFTRISISHTPTHSHMARRSARLTLVQNVLMSRVIGRSCFNFSFETGFIPDNWGTAVVTPWKTVSKSSVWFQMRLQFSLESRNKLSEWV